MNTENQLCSSKMPYKNLFSISNFLKKLITNLGIGLQKWRCAFFYLRFPSSKHNKWMIRMAGLGPSLQKPESLAECLELACSPAAHTSKPTEAAPGFQSLLRKRHISDVKTTPLLGRDLRKIYKYLRGNLFLVSLDNRILEKSMWAREQGRG